MNSHPKGQTDDLDDGTGRQRFEPLDQGVATQILARRRQARSAVILDSDGSPGPAAGGRPAGRPQKGRDGHLERKVPAEPMPSRPGQPPGILEGAARVAIRSDECVRGRSTPGACSRCLEICPAAAVVEDDGRIRLDHQACQGCGLCAVVCPTGAMRYLQPSTQDLLVAVHSRLADARLDSSVAPVVVFHSCPPDERPHDDHAPDGSQQRITAALPAAGCAGPEVWLGALAYGAGRVVVRLPGDYPSTLRQALNDQREWAASALRAAGLPADRIQLIEGEASALPAADPIPATFPAADFSPFQSKRALIRGSIAHLAGCTGRLDGVANLPAGAPFGAVAVDPSACTLCMACAGACPTAALNAAGDTPALNLLESECIQCGRCLHICPEGALALLPRMMIDPDRAGRLQRLHAREPLRCIVCGRGFAPPGIVAKLIDRLEGHPMFAAPEQRRRLKMCRSCRVEDLLLAGEAAVDP